jgi:hypothetical protein
MKTTFKLASIASVVALSSWGCKKNFLEEPPRVQTVNDYFSTTNQAAKEMVNAIYNKLYAWETHSFSWMGMSEIASDNSEKGSDPGDTGADKDQLDDYFFSPTSISFGEVWNSNFEGIARANKAIDFIGKLDLPSAEKDRWIAEARFLRGYFYYNLVRSFGGVPKIDKVPVTEQEISNTYVRASADEIWDLIESDFQAATVLPNQQLVDLGRATSDAARAFLAKTALYRKKWSTSLSYCEALISSGKYSLMADYSHIWREIGEFSEESIWEVNCKGTDPQKGIIGYFVVQAPRSGARGLGWGFNTPTKDLMDAYEPGDLRKDATIITSGQTLWDGWETDPNHANKYYNYKAYVSRIAESWGKGDNETTKNLRVIRYAEVLLMASEAENELGNASKACEYLNTVRKRAGLTDFVSTDQNEIRQAVWKERRVELAFEHDRTFDLRRQGRIGDVMRAHGKAFVDGKHELFPIPQRQIDLGEGKLIQNPGY